ncbi:MAG: hypothetical protein M0Q38_14255 [Bacteroidales bacterium]|jgi:hypothetical protein|nr:hypothetical protein [Bacteroidales bacterium]
MKTRNFLMLFMLAVIPVLFFSCDKLTNLTAVNVTYKVPRIPFKFTPTALKSGEIILCTEQVNLNVDSLLNANLPGGGLDTTSFSNFSITIEAPDTANFGWLQSARTVVSQDSTFTSHVQIGTVTNNDSTTKTVILTMNNDNIRPYLGTKGFYIRVYAVVNGAIPYNWIQMYIDSQLKMRIEPL